ncbi:hypothetical protein D1007_28850 [Hordeum vulgare]|uniref:Uncharacterized protein n=1 Tax=Hordeum vulgare subsp. vulgare TaxID=112509 RepID=A0A8I6YHT7_HORVV|nr:ESX-1 secretion-associated protein EspI-like [Hordeum vulgare subsp. vulgare]KAE8796143.1 hypothetical protein D1007_28850 [Hordeum vulgare]
MAYSKGGGMSSAVDAILAEAADLVALEQIARLNTAHLAGLDDAALPSSLESRFRKLKSLPAAAPAPAPAPPAKTMGRSVTAPPQSRDDDPAADPPHQPHADHPAPVAPASQEPKEQSPPPQPRADPPKTSVPAVQEDEEEDLERLFGAGRGRPTLRERNRGRDDDGGSLSPPPPRQACCFPFSPKKAPTARSRKDRAAGGTMGDVLGIDAGEWGDENRRVVTELKEQQRKLKKALEEQVKVSRETAKMARWVKQASARMTHTDAIDDLLSDIDDDEELK